MSAINTKRPNISRTKSVIVVSGIIIIGGFVALMGRILFAMAPSVASRMGMSIDDRTQPDYQAMRQYRISKMTDDQIRSAHVAAQTELDIYLKRRQDHKKVEDRCYYTKLSQCGDLVFA